MLDRGADSWDLYHDLSKLPVAKVLAQRDVIYRILNEFQLVVEIYAGFLAALASILALVSTWELDSEIRNL